nr:MAG TPA: hypothetical protein [Bacteriophage sp.]
MPLCQPPVYCCCKVYCEMYYVYIINNLYKRKTPTLCRCC